jgi:hypothetical protein
VAEVLEEMARRDPSILVAALPPGPLSGRERLLVHACTFLIGSWNLLLANLEHYSGRLWSLYLIGLWAVILVVHTVVCLLSPQQTCPKSPPDLPA